MEGISDKYKENAAVFWGWLYFLKGENDKAIEYYSRALKYLKKAKGKNKVYFNTIGGLFFILALLKDGSINRLKEAQEYANLIARESEHWLKSTYTQLRILLQIQQGDINQKEFITSAKIPSLEKEHSLETLFSALCLYWVDESRAKKRLPKILEPIYQQAVTSGYQWLAMETAELLFHLKPRSSYDTQAAIYREDSGILTIVELIKPLKGWELCLKCPGKYP